jgi:hypothetical protein
MKEKSPDTTEKTQTAIPPGNIFNKCLVWVRRHLPVIILGIIFVIAAFIRLWAAEISSGPDVAQFWAFAKVFQAHGLDFYRYADARLPIFPVQGWGFVYPPVWLLISRVALFFSPSSQVNIIAGNSIANPAWRLAMKIPIITADLAIGLLLYWAVPGSKRKKVFFAALWLLHPTAWFESGVFGQFDAIAAAFLLACVILLIKGKDRLAFIFAGLAVMTKQHTLIPVIMIVIVCAGNMNIRRLLTNCVIMAGVIALISIPFCVTGNFIAYARSIIFAGAAPGYQNPLCFSFSGTGALLTFLHNVLGWDTTIVITLTLPLLFIFLIVTAILCYRRRITPLQGALAGFLVFVSLYYRINYQYLVIFIPLAILLASRTQYRLERIFALAIAVLPAVWIWLGSLPWWFHDTKPGYSWVIPMFRHLGLLDRYLSDWVYVTFTCVLMCLSLAYVVLAFTKWQKPADSPSAMVYGKEAATS